MEALKAVTGPVGSGSESGGSPGSVWGTPCATGMDTSTLPPVVEGEVAAQTDGWVAIPRRSSLARRGVDINLVHAPATRVPPASGPKRGRPASGRRQGGGRAERPSPGHGGTPVARRTRHSTTERGRGRRPEGARGAPQYGIRASGRGAAAAGSSKPRLEWAASGVKPGGIAPPPTPEDEQKRRGYWRESTARVVLSPQYTIPCTAVPRRRSSVGSLSPTTTLVPEGGPSSPSPTGRASIGSMAVVDEEMEVLPGSSPGGAFGRGRGDEGVEGVSKSLARLPAPSAPPIASPSLTREEVAMETAPLAVLTVESTPAERGPPELERLPAGGGKSAKRKRCGAARRRMRKEWRRAQAEGGAAVEGMPPSGEGRTAAPPEARVRAGQARDGAIPGPSGTQPPRKRGRLGPGPAMEALGRKSYAQTAAGTPRVAVVHNGYPGTALQAEHLWQFRTAVAEILVEGATRGLPPVGLASSVLARGAIVVDATTEDGVELVRKVVNKWGPSVEGGLQVVAEDQLVKLTTVTIPVAGMNLPPAKAILLLGYLNGMDTARWVVHSASGSLGGPNKGYLLVVGVDGQAMDRLKELGWRVSLGAETVTVRVKGPSQAENLG